MTGGNCAIYVCSPSKANLGVSTYRCNTVGTTRLKKPPFIKAAIFFSDVILVSNYYGCKGETIKLIPYTLFLHKQHFYKQKTKQRPGNTLSLNFWQTCPKKVCLCQWGCMIICYENENGKIDHINKTK